MTRHIGIIGVSPEGTAICYREIFRNARKRLGAEGHPRVTLHNEPLKDYVDAVLRNDWAAVGTLLSKSARILAESGAEFCIVPDNLMQHGVHLAESRSPIPFLTMADLVGEAIQSDGREVVGLIGTKLVMVGSTYQTHLGLRGIRVLVPDEDDAEAMDAIIFGELIYGVVRRESQQRVKDIIARLAERGCEGVVLGLSEAPLVVAEHDAPVPVYDATRLLAIGAVSCAIGERKI